MPRSLSLRGSDLVEPLVEIAESGLLGEARGVSAVVIGRLPAPEMFISFGADAFRERTRRELLATGEKGAQSQ